MTSTPALNRFLFWIYLSSILVVGIAALIWPAVRSLAYAPLRDILFPNVFLPTQASAPVTLSVAAPPALEGWLKASAATFAEQNPFIRVEITQLRGLEADNRLNTLTGQTDIWIAEDDFARAAAAGIPYDTRGSSVATDSFVWVAVKTHPELSGNLNWGSIAAAAGHSAQFRIAMPPTHSIEGMAACWLAATEYHRTGSVNIAQINDPAFRAWLARLLEAAPDRNRSPRDQLSARPPQGDAGLILKSDWSQLAQQSFFAQPEDRLVFDYPSFMRTTWPNMQPEEANAHREAAATFRAYLLGDGPQGRLRDFGLGRASSGQPAGPLSQMDELTLRALQFCW